MTPMRKTSTTKRDRSPAKRLPSGAYAATPELEQQLLVEHEVVLRGGPYVARVTHSTRRWYEAWTDDQPFAYGPGAETLQGALDALHVAVEARRGGDEAKSA